MLEVPQGINGFALLFAPAFGSSGASFACVSKCRYHAVCMRQRNTCKHTHYGTFWSPVKAPVKTLMSCVVYGMCYTLMANQMDVMGLVVVYKIANLLKRKWSESRSVVSDSLQPHTVHGILQAKILEGVAFPLSRGSSQPRDQIQVSCIAGEFFTSWVTMEALTAKTHCLLSCQKLGLWDCPFLSCLFRDLVRELHVYIKKNPQK